MQFATHALPIVIFPLILLSCCLAAEIADDGLVLHLDASAASSIETDEAGKVSIWRDPSAKDNHVKQQDSGKRPRIEDDALNRMPVMRFSGAEYMDGPAVLPAGDRTFTFIAVWKRNDTRGVGVICEQASEGIGRRASLLTVHQRYGFNGQNNDQHRLIEYKGGLFNISIMTLNDNGTVRLWHNDNTNATGARGKIDSTIQDTGDTMFRVGAKISNAAERLNGDIAEILVYDRVLAFDELKAINYHLGEKWNIGPRIEDGKRTVETMSKEKMDEGPDYTSDVPRFTFSDTLNQQQAELAENPLLQRFAESRKSMADDPWRPDYHFVSPESTMNDPNGLCFWQGRWHLFYQGYPPEDPRQHWGHAVSDDLLHWRDLPYAIYPHPEEKCFSGATFVEDDRVIAMYHGTRAGNMVATSSDPLLLNWNKVADKPVVPMRNEDGSRPPYRVFDPCIWKKNGMYYSLSAGQLPEGPAGRPIRADFLLRSQNLVDWEYLHPFVEADRFTLVGDDGACPYFWPIGDRHMLLFFSHMSGGQYILGDYDKDRDKLVATNHGYFNFGAVGPGGVHAPSATPDGEGGLIVIFNMNPGKPTQGWNQIMSLPRRLTVIGEDRIGIEPAGDIPSLRGTREHIEARKLPANEEIVLEDVTGKSLEIMARIQTNGAPLIEMNVLRSPDKKEFTRIAFYQHRGYHNRAYHPDRHYSVVTLDNSYSSALPDARSRPPENAPVLIHGDEPLNLRVFVDSSIVEVFVNGKQCVAMRVYPGREDSTGVSLRSQGRDAQLLSLDAWEMENIYE